MTIKPADNRTCCDGRCCDGQECPLMREEIDPLRDDMLEAVNRVILLAIGVVAAGVVTISLMVHL